jgi:hypothetical protein
LLPLQLAGHAIEERRLLFSRQSDGGSLDHDLMARFEEKHWSSLLARYGTVTPAALSRQPPTAGNGVCPLPSTDQGGGKRGGDMGAGDLSHLIACAYTRAHAFFLVLTLPEKGFCRQRREM